MKLDVFIITAVLAVTPIHAQYDFLQEESQPQQKPLSEEWQSTTIGHDEVVPFAEPKPVTISEKAGVKFKPQLVVYTGCEPYPAVNEAGETSGGLRPTGDPSGGCRRSKHGSQVYGRSTWVNGVWAIMYSWYFAKDSPMPLLGHRHDWEHVVLFIDDPAIPEPTILGCSSSWYIGYLKYAPCPEDSINGFNVMIKYEHSFPHNHALNITSDAGSYQDLIMWKQMSDLARRALNDTDFGEAITPMNDLNFRENVAAAWPFKTKKARARNH